MNININTNISNSTSCRCDLGYIIKDHIKLLMQLLTNDLPQFNFRMQTTKCLNTAIMLVQFLLGDKGLKMADSCDTRAVITRHSQGIETNNIIMTDLKKQLFSKREKSRTLYYILLSDGYFPTQESVDKKYFPGHVFILEKIWDTSSKQHMYYFYQSYINKYTLREHIVMNKGLLITTKRASELINHLERVLNSETWSQESVKMWYDMTFADSSNLLESNSKQRFFLCFRKAKTTICLEKVKKYLTRHARRLKKQPAHQLDDIYGDASLYDEGSKPFTNRQVMTHIDELLQKMSVKTNVNVN